MTRSRFLDLVGGLALGALASGAFSGWVIRTELTETAAGVRTELAETRAEVRALRRDVDRLISRGRSE